MAIYNESKNIVLENDLVKITVSSETALVESVWNKVNGNEMKGEDVHFFSFVENDKETKVYPTSLELSGNIITVNSAYGKSEYELNAESDYFTVELLSSLPDEIYKVLMANVKYDYDREDKDAICAAGMAVTYWANPCFYPDAKAKETKAEVTRYLKDKGAKYAFFVAPLKDHQELLKKITLTIDKNTGIRSELGGAWGQECQLNHDNGMLLYYTEDEYLDKNISFFEALGVDQIDICQGGPSAYYQGSFEYRYHKDAADFKKRFSDRVAKYGMYPGLHTYAATVALDSATILSNPEYQKQMVVKDTFTLASDIDENTMLIPIEENPEDVCCDFSFLSKNSPLIIIDGEVMRYDKAEGGICLTHRGYAGTKEVPHKQGAEIVHLSGLYYNAVPEIGSQLFFDIAKNTAKAFDEGGYKSIYLDALDAIRRFIDDEDEEWFHCAAFICELLKHCKKTPMIEASCMYPSMWACRGRFGAWDIGRRGYKEWNKAHIAENGKYTDMYGTATLGWYSFYPIDNKHPGNFHSRYQFIDDIDHLGTLSLAYNFGMVFNDIESEDYFFIPALRRNIAHYRKYDDLRKAYYFSDDILKKLRESEGEYQLHEKENGEFVFVEKKYQQKKFYDVQNPERNSETFVNPYGKHTPFMRVMAHISSVGENALSLVELDKNAPFPTKKLTKEFEQEINLTTRCARKVSVLGNGKKGTVAILIHGRETGREGVMAYYIDTDFEGWRDFVLAESDNGNYPEFSYEQKMMEGEPIYFHLWKYLRNNACDDRTFKIEIDSCGDVEGVRISGIEAVDHTFEILKNPTVKIGDSAVTFNCDLKSTDYIEFDGEKAIMYDRIGNETVVGFTGSVEVPAGEFAAELSVENTSTAPLRASITFGFTGNEVK